VNEKKEATPERTGNVNALNAIETEKEAWCMGGQDRLATFGDFATKNRSKEVQNISTADS
jgi:hypothetical protein